MANCKQRNLAVTVKDILAVLLLVTSCHCLPNEYLKFRPFFMSDYLNQMQSDLSESQRTSVETPEDTHHREISHAMPGDGHKWLRPKSLQISYEPTNNDSKLKITDTFLDSVRKDTTEHLKKTPSTKKPKRPQPTNKLQRPHNKSQLPSSRPLAENRDVQEVEESTTQSPLLPPAVFPQLQKNHLSGLSQIGNRESQMVIKPTVIVNIRGTVSNTDSDIRVASRSQAGEAVNPNVTDTANVPRSIFQINQEVNIQNDLLPPDGDAADSTKITAVSKGRSSESLLDVGADGLHKNKMGKLHFMSDYLEFDLFK